MRNPIAPLTRSRFAALTCSLLGLLLVASPTWAAEPVTGKETTAPSGYWLPENYSTFGGTVDHLFYGILYLTSAINIAVFIVLIVFLLKYRHRTGRIAKFIHGNNKLETVWTIIPAAILIFIGLLSHKSWSHIKSVHTMPKPESSDVVEIDVVAQQFLWNFHYPGSDGRLGRAMVAELINPNGPPDEQIGLDRNGDGKDDLVLTRLVVPVNKKILIHLTSKDVIHSFFLPNFRIKQDAVPGLHGKVWFESTKTSVQAVGRKNPADVLPGDELLGYAKPFDLACAELCGQGHFKMRSDVFVVTQEQFESYMNEQSKQLLQNSSEETY